MQARSASGGTGSERGARAMGDGINKNIPHMSDRERLGTRQLPPIIQDLRMYGSRLGSHGVASELSLPSSRSRSGLVPTRSVSISP